MLATLLIKNKINNKQQLYQKIHFYKKIKYNQLNQLNQYK